MNESELGRALRGTVGAGSPPLALDATGMLAHARKARVRRRATLAAAASVLAVVAVGGAAALTGNLAFGGNGKGGGIQAGSGGCQQYPAPESPIATETVVATKIGATPQRGGGPAPTPTGTVTGSPTPAETASCDNTERPWPSGQSDRTAHAGPHHQQALALESTLKAALPTGARLHTDLVQGEFNDWVGNTEVWDYSVYGSVALPKHGSNGIVLIVISPRPGDHRSLCQLAQGFQSNPGPICSLHTVRGKQVAFATLRPGNSVGGYSPQPEHWVVYRAPNGTLVMLGVGRHYGDTPATADVWTTQQMAELVASGRFDI
jgi:hypothetical protein